MNKFRKIVLGVSLCMACAVSASAATEYAYPIITPWNTSTDFNSSSFDYTDKAASAAQWNLWPSTYTKVCAMKDCVVKTTDSRTGDDGENMYDSVSGETGDKYLYFGYSDKWVEPTSNSNTGYIYFNDKSKSNGGLCFGAAAYEFDIRISDIFKADSVGTKISLLDADGKNVVGLPVKHDDADSWYVSYTSSDGASHITDDFEADKWYRFSIYADASTQSYVFVVKSRESGAAFVSDECSYAAATTKPLKTTISVQCPKYADTSLDNLSVTKEAFIVSKPVISDDGTAVSATVGAANSVYAAPGFGDAAPDKSPLAVMVSYDVNDKMVAMAAGRIDFSGHDTANVSDFSKDAEYGEISLSYAKPSSAVRTVVYVMNGYDEMKPY